MKEKKFLVYIFFILILWLIKQVSLAEETDTFGQYYEDISSHPKDFWIAWIFQYQNEDWSICINNTKCIRDTYFALKWIKKLWLDHDKITNAYNFLSSATWKNTIENSYIIESKIWNWKETQNKIQNMLYSQNTNWWFGLRAWYESDLISSLSILRLINNFPSQYISERTSIESYLLNYKNSDWELAIDPSHHGDIELNLILLDSYKNMTWSTFVTWAKQLVSNTINNNKYSILLNQQAYIIYLKNEFFLDNDLDDFSFQLSAWQWNNGIINNIITTSLSLSSLAEIYIWPEIGTITWSKLPCELDWTWDIFINSSCTIDSQETLSNNIIIESWAIVFISSWAILDIDMRNNYLKVKKWWWLLIKQWGKLN